MNHTVDKAVTPQNIKSGFRCTGICSFDSDVFNETDFIEAVLSGENDQAAAVETLYNEEEQRRIFVSNEQDVAAHEEVSTAEPSTSQDLRVSVVRKVYHRCFLKLGQCKRQHQRKNQIVDENRCAALY